VLVAGTVLARAQRTMTVGLWQVGLSEDSEFNLYHSIPLPLDEIVPRSGHAEVGYAPFGDAISWLFVGICSSV
jgi:hypothetical protein